MFAALNNLIASLPPGVAETAGIWVAALLTLAVLSYILGNNLFFRLAEHLFVGIAAGYAAAMTWHHALWPRLQLLLNNPTTYWYYGVFFVLGLLLLARGSRSMAVLGNLPLGALFGMGAALALGGALTGSLIPQMRASVMSLAPGRYGEGLAGTAYAIDALLLILGTIAVLGAFQFTVREGGPLGWLWQGLHKLFGSVGRGLIMITFGALLAGAMLSFLTILSGRLAFLVHDWLGLLGNAGR